MNLPKKVYLIGWEFSRRGGIEEVSRQVADIIKKSDLYALKIIKFPKSNKLSIIYRFVMRMQIRNNNVYFFMHPYIFEKCRSLFSSPSSAPTLVWAHGIEVWGSFGKQHAHSLSSATKIIASSHFTRDRILENFPSADVSVARLAVHTKPSFHPMDESKTFEILTLGRLAGNERYKGHDLVLKALAILKSKGIEVKYHIVGVGPDQERLLRLAQDLNLSHQVIFHGYIPDSETDEVYAKSSAFVMPSHVSRHDTRIWSGEGFGLVYLEAAMHGLPIIACDEGGQRDCVVDGETGFLVKPDPALIADRILWLMENKAASIHMGEQGRNFVLSNFTPEHFKRDVLEIIDQAFLKKGLKTLHSR
jgi:phosphatidylinositol alpha-1,6-mannosyltransferase